MKKFYLITVILSGIVFLNFSVNSSKELYAFKLPAGFPPISYDTGLNSFSAAKFELGKKLFYDPLLSRTNTVSCASCHKQEHAFSDAGNKLSKGIEQKAGSRNAPSLANLAWNKYFFWDGSVESLDLQPVIPITNHVEMDETVETLISKLNADRAYKALFKRAFGTENITFAGASQALSQFLIHCISASSRYDEAVIRKTNRFNRNERDGYILFKKHCNTCHTEPLFTNQAFANNGISAAPDNDAGRFLVTGQHKDRYFFKVPSLRNIALTAPYMHDGRFATLEEVLSHYQMNLKQLPSLNPSLNKVLSKDTLTQKDKTNLIYFLKSLTDSSFIHNPTLKQ